MHQAIQKALNNSTFCAALFPTEEIYLNYKTRLSKALEKTSYSSYISDKTAIIDKKLNLQQLEVVNSIGAVSESLAAPTAAQKDHASLPPLIIYGPPGTGESNLHIHVLSNSSLADAVLIVLCLCSV